MNIENSNGNLYNNADSFAMAFDIAWNDSDFKKDNKLTIEEKIEISFNKIKSHPFLIKNPVESKQIAFFRIKLLGL
tara:strand:- start:5957 stop:6184 length:228 start_codon:yes stop_codon:yes gene_type:complete